MSVQQYEANILTTILEHAYEGVAVVDKNGDIIHFNDAYCRILGVKKEEAIGRYVTDVIENTRLHHILETGVPERGKLQTIAGQKMVVHRIPVWEGGTVVAAIGMLVFEGVSELYEILDQLEENTNYSEKRLLKVDSKKDKQNQSNTNFDEIIGQSEALVNTKRLAQKASKTLATVLITGESGTGKELFAKAIHEQSPYADGQFVSINCAAIPEHLLEAELFGYEEGAFTGAKKGGKQGLIELASHGTLFLDEIGDMPLHMQSKLLRVLQEKEVVRVGGIKPYPTNARIVAATNKNLLDLINEDQFREDLYYRLNIIPIHIPPLRARKSDVRLLLAKILEDVCQKYETNQKQFTAPAISMLMKYHWPGNVREMMNIIEQLVSLVDKEHISPQDLPIEIHTENEPSSASKFEHSTEKDWFHEFKSNKNDEEKEYILKALKQTNGNKAQAAKLLGIHRSTLYDKLKKFHIT
ncbi:sigma-54 interaction domain-containing protein [Texcoconibacillus texcoconensis]|uniref:Transcriptional regulator with PAS, ATPase and Fis domain n=1 Tax=Texcoconibacillus texcoconensis TaxID=1095777 RepID=A0A840QT42_9BACI|nr:sigma 54-interacting transcriptional regulator [Texcoconibacillus texcoconensis]MBB5174478.1 transcriptional regulator with PAS, ATPase and Fis domain [Texcoconibacillus texcoconensis]